MIPDSKTSGRAGLVRAAVMVGDVETQYRRAGSGPSLIVLRELSEPQLLDLATRARVIVPDTTTIAALALGPAGARPFVQWLAGFLEGLGVTFTTILAPATLASELAELAEAHPGVVHRVLLCGARGELSFPADIDVRWLAPDADVLSVLG